MKIWRHVGSKDNPADCASRGMLLNELEGHGLWWNGPSFLYKQMEEWPVQRQGILGPEQEWEERRQTRAFNVTLTTSNEILNRFSNIDRLLFVTAYALRWRSRTKGGVTPSPCEKEEALHHWIRLTQHDIFASEYEALQAGREISTRSRLLKLNPQWSAEERIIRVGGRIRNANIAMEAKHPAIIPNKTHLSWLIIDNAHKKVLHGGVQVTARYIRKRFWILHDRQSVKTQLQKCVQCFRFKQQAGKQQMGDLPRMRVQMNRPFHHTGIDFAGYFDVKLNALRSTRFTKCYVAIFICLTTKAIHLELVSDLSTRAFIDALKKFVSRRGIPLHIHSDNGTNFVGASNELPKMLHDASSTAGQLVAYELLKDNIQWHFNPAHAPHFGGIWEANVRVMKMHLNRVLQGKKLWFDEFCTILCQIEAVMNSRPLCPLTDDVDDDEAITPSHLLVGYAINTLPETSAAGDESKARTRYERMRMIYQDFWHQWSQDYLAQLQQRTKWNTAQPNAHIGQLVLLRDENLPPSRWVMGRILRVFPGKDSLVRAVELRRGGAIITRPVHQLCILPIDE